MDHYREIYQIERRKRQELFRELLFSEIKKLSPELLEYIVKNSPNHDFFFEMAKDELGDSKNLISIHNLGDVVTAGNHYNNPIGTKFETLMQSLNSFLNNESPYISVLGLYDKLKPFKKYLKNHPHIRFTQVNCGVKANELIKNDAIDIFVSDFSFIYNGYGNKIMNSLLRSKAVAILHVSNENDIFYNGKGDIYYPNYFDQYQLIPCSDGPTKYRKKMEEDIKNNPGVKSNLLDTKKKRLILPESIGKIVSSHEKDLHLAGAISDIYNGAERNLNNIVKSIADLYLMTLYPAIQSGAIDIRNKDLLKNFTQYRFMTPVWVDKVTFILDNRLAQNGYYSLKDMHDKKIDYFLDTCAIDENGIRCRFDH